MVEVGLAMCNYGGLIVSKSGIVCCVGLMRLEAEAGESKSARVASSMGGFVYKGVRGGDNNAIHAAIDEISYI